MMKAALLGIGLTMSVALSYAGTPPDSATTSKDVAAYKLRQMCSAAAAAWYKKQWTDDASWPSDASVAHYRDHYNHRLGACLMLLTIDTIMKGKSGPYTMTTVDLFDVDEGTDYGSYTEYSNRRPPSCVQRGMSCVPMEKWQKTMKRLMSE